MVDSINGVDKNIIYREAMKQVADPDNVYKPSSSKLQAFFYNNVPGENNYSAAMNSKFVLERNGGEGVKSEGLRSKRESDRVINKRYWYVIKITDKLSDVKCNTIKDFQIAAHFLICITITLVLILAQEKLL